MFEQILISVVATAICALIGWIIKRIMAPMRVYYGEKLAQKRLIFAKRQFIISELMIVFAIALLAVRSGGNAISLSALLFFPFMTLHGAFDYFLDALIKSHESKNNENAKDAV